MSNYNSDVPSGLAKICSVSTQEQKQIKDIEQKKRIIWFIFAFSKEQIAGDFKKEIYYADEWKRKLDQKGFFVYIEKDCEQAFPRLIQAIEDQRTVGIIWSGHGGIQGLLGIGGDSYGSDRSILADPLTDNAIVEVIQYKSYHEPVPEFVNEIGNAGIGGSRFYRRICLGSVSARLQFVVFYSCLTDARSSDAAKDAQDLEKGPKIFPKKDTNLSEEIKKKRQEILGGLDDWRKILNHNRGTGKSTIAVYGTPTSTSTFEAIDPNSRMSPRKRADWKNNGQPYPPGWDVGVKDLELIIDDDFINRNRYEDPPNS